jgi:hypothetical protein
MSVLWTIRPWRINKEKTLFFPPMLITFAVLKTLARFGHILNVFLCKLL